MIFWRGRKITPKCRRIENSISKTLKVNYSGQNGSILACNTNFPLKFKCSFVWNRFSPGKKIPEKIRFFAGQFFEIFVTGCIPKEGSNYTFLDSPDSSGSKNTKFSAVEIFGYLILLWSCCGREKRVFCKLIKHDF